MTKGIDAPYYNEGIDSVEFTVRNAEVYMHEKDLVFFLQTENGAKSRGVL